MNKVAAKKIVVKSASVILAFSGAAFFWLHEIWFLALAIPPIIILKKYKPTTVEEKAQLEDLSTKSTILFLTLPIGILLLMCLVFIGWVVRTNIGG